MVQSTTSPLLLRHRTSDLTSRLKSPIPATLQEASGTIGGPLNVTSAADGICDPFMVQSTSSPLVFRHRTSDFPSPLKSFSTAMVGGVTEGPRVMKVPLAPSPVALKVPPPRLEV